MCWMHRGAIACAFSYIKSGDPGSKFIQFFMKMTNLLLSYNINPILIFDGKSIPVKSSENKVRETRRANAKLEAEGLIKKGVSLSDKRLRTLAMQSIHVSNDMIYRVILALRKAGLKYLIAPYEADAQLAYLCHANIVDAVITEDSDLLAYACPRVLFKLNDVGHAQEIDLSQILLNGVNSLNSFGINNKSIENNLFETSNAVHDENPVEQQVQQQEEENEKSLTLNENTTEQKENDPSDAADSDKLDESSKKRDFNDLLTSFKYDSDTPSSTAKIKYYKKIKSSQSLIDKKTLIDNYRSTSRSKRITEEITSKVLTITDNTIAGKLKHFDWAMFAAMCVLTGCDYTNNVHVFGWGSLQSLNLILKYKTLTNLFKMAFSTPSIFKRIKKLFADSHLVDFSKDVEIDANKVLLQIKPDWSTVVQTHVIAALVFMHHKVYDPRTNSIVGVWSSIPEVVNTGTLYYDKFQCQEDLILGKFSLDGYHLYSYITGHDIETPINLTFSQDEFNEIESVKKFIKNPILYDLQSKSLREEYERLFCNKDHKKSKSKKEKIDSINTEPVQELNLSSVKLLSSESKPHRFHSKIDNSSKFMLLSEIFESDTSTLTEVFISKTSDKTFKLSKSKISSKKRITPFPRLKDL